jgi:hypothetical protein
MATFQPVAMMGMYQTKKIMKNVGFKIHARISIKHQLAFAVKNVFVVLLAVGAKGVGNRCFAFAGDLIKRGEEEEKKKNNKRARCGGEKFVSSKMGEKKKRF